MDGSRRAMTGVWLESTLSFTSQTRSAIRGRTRAGVVKRLLGNCSAEVINKLKNTTKAQGADLKGTHKFTLRLSDSCMWSFYPTSN